MNDGKDFSAIGLRVATASDAMQSENESRDTGYSGKRALGAAQISRAAQLGVSPENSEIEFSASEIRKLLQCLFPHRRLVLSQFTFFNQVGVSRPTGQSYRRGRRCYRLVDILPIACILALKEEGIPYKNVESVPAVLQTHSEKIFRTGAGVRLSGFGANVELCFPGEEQLAEPYLDFLSGDFGIQLFWSFDVGNLAQQLAQVAQSYQDGTLELPSIAAA